MRLQLGGAVALRFELWPRTLCCVIEQDNFTLIAPLHQFVQVGTGDLNAGGNIPSSSLRDSVIGISSGLIGHVARIQTYKATVCVGD